MGWKGDFASWPQSADRLVSALSFTTAASFDDDWPRITGEEPSGHYSTITGVALEGANTIGLGDGSRLRPQTAMIYHS